MKNMLFFNNLGAIAKGKCNCNLHKKAAANNHNWPQKKCFDFFCGRFFVHFFGLAIVQ